VGQALARRCAFAFFVLYRLATAHLPARSTLRWD
jgi:hypothetical protein